MKKIGVEGVIGDISDDNGGEIRGPEERNKVSIENTNEGEQIYKVKKMYGSSEGSRFEDVLSGFDLDLIS